MKAFNKIISLILALILIVSLCACNNKISSLNIENGEKVLLKVGYTLQLNTNLSNEEKTQVNWQASNGNVSLDEGGFITAKSEGTTTIIASFENFTDTIVIYVVNDSDYEYLYPIFTEREDEQNANSSELTQRPHEEQIENIQPDGYRDDGFVNNSNNNSAYSSNTFNNYSSSNSGVTSKNNNTTSVTYPSNPLGVDEVARAKFYNGSDPADSYEEALERSRLGKLSGCETVPNQAPTIANNRPKSNGAYIKNSEPYFLDENTYVVVNASGYEVFRVYRGGGYITLEEVAAYLMAFGDVPANYSKSKKTKPTSSIWKENLRVNHSAFSGSTTKYPYEPKLPRISGCGGDLKYYEIDIGTTGTDCDPSYPIRTYNNGISIERGAARIVYSRYDINGNNVIEMDEKFVFYTYNHYNDFREYLNYYNGWGEMFGNITGGGVLSSKYNYNPTPYIKSALAPLVKDFSAAA